MEKNDHCIWVGCVAIVTLPFIGYFDERKYPIAHGIIAGLFFLATTFYAFMLSDLFNSCKDQFPEKKSIEIMSTVRWVMLGMAVMFGISLIFGLVPPLWEWLLVLLYLNYFSFQAFTIPYYDTIHQPGKKPEDDDETIT